MKAGFHLVQINPSDGEKFAHEAIKTADKLGNLEKKAEAYDFLANCLVRNGRYSAALRSLNTSVDLYAAAGNEKMVYYIKNGMAGVYIKLNRHDQALNIYRELLAYYHNKNIMERYCSILNNAGTVFNEKGDYERALENFLKALEIINEINPDDLGIKAIYYCNIGDAYFGKKDFALALKYRKMSLEIYKGMNDRDGIANLQMDIGASLIKLKDYSDAKKYLDSALVNYSAINYPEGIRKTKKLFVQLYQEIKQYDAALNLCSQLENLSIKFKDSVMVSFCYKSYSDIYFALNNFRLSADFYKRYIELKENLDAKENRQRMTELQNAFETEQKDYENKTLRQENELQREKLNSRDNLLIAVTFGVLITFTLLIVLFKKEKKIRHINEQIQEQNRRLEEHIVSKDKFFSILGHNLKNPFWAVLGQNRLLEDEYDELTESERKELISRIGSSANNVYKLFEDLLRWARTQQNAIEVEKERLSLKTLIESSIRPYASMAENKKVRIEVSVREETEIEGDRFMLETVIGNLIDNAIKFSLQEEMILVSGYSTGETVVIRVEDYGVGMAQEKLEKLFRIDEDISSAGTLNEKGTGLGLIICKEFVEKHGGTIKVESREGKGTSFTVHIPLN